MKAIFATAGLLLAAAFVASPVGAADGETFCVNPETGADTNPGTKDKPFKTLPAAADRVNELKGEGAATIILSPGTYALDRQFSLRASRKYTKADRLTIRAEFLPDDAKWDTGKMPTLIHTMPLARKGFTFGMHVETSHVTIQGLKLLGMPGVETPRPGVLNRVYPIGRMDRRLELTTQSETLAVECPSQRRRGSHAPVVSVPESGDLQGQRRHQRRRKFRL
jgi:hypothetical protein